MPAQRVPRIAGTSAGTDDPGWYRGPALPGAGMCGHGKSEETEMAGKVRMRALMFVASMTMAIEVLVSTAGTAASKTWEW